MVLGPDRPVVHGLGRDDEVLLSTAYDGLVDVARRGGRRWHADRPRPRDVAAGDHGRRDNVRVPAPPGYPLFERDAREGRATSCARSSGRSAQDPTGRPGIPRSCPASMREQRLPSLATSAEGVRTDDATGTIVFHLRRPDRRLPGSLAGGPDPSRHAEPRSGYASVPSTGPYTIESYVPEAGTHAGPQSLLSRVVESRPPGRASRRRSSDQIVRPALSGVMAVAAWTGRRHSFLLVHDGRQGARGVPSALPVTGSTCIQEQATVFLFLNTTLPPFDDVRVRRALNLAVDRGCRFKDARGPGVRSSRPASSARRAPSPSGDTAPTPPLRTGQASGRRRTLRAARRLVAASGTHGMKVTVWTAPRS